MANNKVENRSDSSIARMTKAEVQAWVKRWQLVDAFQREERLTRAAAARLRALEKLLKWAQDTGWSSGILAEIDEIQERWQGLRNVVEQRDAFMSSRQSQRSSRRQRRER
jgi:hypothetical protein